jgi:hypothetical protein
LEKLTSDRGNGILTLCRYFAAIPRPLNAESGCGDTGPLVDNKVNRLESRRGHDFSIIFGGVWF